MALVARGAVSTRTVEFTYVRDVVSWRPFEWQTGKEEPTEARGEEVLDYDATSTVVLN